MKLKGLLVASVVCLAVLYLAVIAPASARGEKRRRAELHLLDTINGGVSYHLELGGQLPANWMELSNAVKWDLVQGISEYNELPPPTELYTVLKKPVDLGGQDRSVFLVRSQPCNWPGRSSGRWVVGYQQGWPTDGNDQPVRIGSSNRVYRKWVAEDFLPAEIRSQLAANLPH